MQEKSAEKPELMYKENYPNLNNINNLPQNRNSQINQNVVKQLDFYHNSGGSKSNNLSIKKGIYKTATSSNSNNSTIIKDTNNEDLYPNLSVDDDDLNLE